MADGRGRRVTGTRRARIVLALVSVVATLGMHAIVAAVPASAHHGSHDHLSAAAAMTPAAAASGAEAEGVPSPEPGHQPADHGALAHLCLALAAAVFLLLVRRLLVAWSVVRARPSAGGSPSFPVLWARPPPDTVSLLCVCRT